MQAGRMDRWNLVNNANKVRGGQGMVIEALSLPPLIALMTLQRHIQSIVLCEYCPSYLLSVGLGIDVLIF